MVHGGTFIEPAVHHRWQPERCQARVAEMGKTRWPVSSAMRPADVKERQQSDTGPPRRNIIVVSVNTSGPQRHRAPGPRRRPRGDRDERPRDRARRGLRRAAIPPCGRPPHPCRMGVRLTHSVGRCPGRPAGNPSSRPWSFLSWSPRAVLTPPSIEAPGVTRCGSYGCAWTSAVADVPPFGEGTQFFSG